MMPQAATARHTAACGAVPGAPGRWAVRLVWALGAVATLYVIFRAFTLSMTCDEAWSAQDLPKETFFAFVSPAFIAALNNHLLNSWLMNLSLTAFGKTDWAARLPALCGGLLYIAMSCRLALSHASSWRSPALVALLLGNPYLLDFLSIGRGYSLGLAFMLLGLSRLISDQERERAWHLGWFALAVLSNLSFLYAYLAALALLWGEVLLRRNRSPRWREAAASSALTLAGLAAVYVRPLVLAVSNNEHWWGSRQGFVGGTLASLLQVSAYERQFDPTVFASLARALVALLLVAAASGLVLAARREGVARAGRPFIMVIVLFGVCWFGLVAEHTLFGTPYVIERGALFLYPLMCLILAFWAEFASASRLSAALSGVTLAAVLALCGHNLAGALNLTHVATWRNDACARAFVTRIHEENHPRNFTQETVRVATLGIHGHTLNYYIDRLGMGYISASFSESGTTDAEYLLLDAGQAAQVLAGGGFEELMRCNVGDGLLLRRVRTVRQ